MIKNLKTNNEGTFMKNFLMKILFATVFLGILSLGNLYAQAFTSGEVVITSEPTGTVGYTGLSVGYTYDGSAGSAVDISVQLQGSISGYIVDIGKVTGITGTYSTTVSLPDLSIYPDQTWSLVRVIVSYSGGATYGWTDGTGFTTGPSWMQVNLSLSSAADISENGGTKNVIATITGGTPDANVTVGLNWTNAGDITGEGDITILSGQTTGFVTVTGANDDYLEGDESISASLSGTYTYSGTGTIGDGTTTSASFILNDNDILHIEWASATVNEAGTSINLIANVQDFTTQAIGGTNESGVLITSGLTWSGTATGALNEDYTQVSSISLANGASQGTASILITDDSKLEGNETITVASSGLTAGPSGANSNATAVTTTIVDDEVATVIGPNNAVTLSDLNPVFSWNSMTGATEYRLEVNKTNSFNGGSDIIFDATVALTSVDFSTATLTNPLEDGQTYYWRVTASDGTNNSSPSTARSFTTPTQILGGTVADGDHGVTVTPTLAWNAVTGATNYVLQYGTASNLSGATAANTSGLSLTIGPLAYNTNYYWAVTGQNARSGIQSFATQLSPLTNLSVPGSGADQPITNAIAFDYTHAGGVSNAVILIRYRYNDGSGFTPYTNLINATYSANQSFNESFTVPYNVDVEWEYSVTNADEATDVQSGSGAFRTLLAQPVLTSPADGYITTDRRPSISFTHASNTNNVLYDFGYTYNTVAQAPIAGVTSGSTPFSTDMPLGRYVWDITANDNQGSANGTNTSKTSSNGTWQFDIVPALVAPVNGLTGVSTQPEMIWRDGGVSPYTIEIATDAGFTNIVTSYDVSGDTTYQFVEYDMGMPLNNSTLYYWRIKYTAAGIDFYSNTWHFTTVPTVSVSLSWPENGAEVFTNDTQFTWFISQATGTIMYAVQVRDTIGVPVEDDWHYTLLDYADTTSNLFTNFTLLNGKKYYWRVIALNSLGQTISYSPTYYFTTAGGAANPPTLSWPTNSAVIYTETPQFTWYLTTPQTDITYDIQIDNDQVEGNGTVFNQTNVSNLFYSISSGVLFAGNSYYWRVRSVYKRGTGDEQTSSYTAYRSFSIAGGANVTVYPSYPVGGALVYTNSPTVYWYLNVYAPGVTYTVRYGTDPTLTAGTNLAPTTDLFATLPTLQPGTVYYWQVRPTYNSTDGNWSTIASFKTNGSGTLVVPIPSYPIGGVTIYTTAPTFYWYLGASGDGLVYDLEIVESSGSFTGTPTAGAAYNDVVSLYSAIGGLTPGKTYKWKVRSDNGSTQSSWSSEASFTVDGGINNGYPVATWPIGNSTVFTAAPTLYWYLEGSSLGLTKYVVRWKETSNSSDWASDYDGTADVNDVNTTYYTFGSALNYGSTYYWAVASYDGTSYSNWSTGSFTVVGGNGSASLVLSYPSNGGSITQTSSTFYWYLNGTSIGIQGYELIYSRSDVFASGTDAFGTVTNTVAAGTIGTNLFYSVSGLVPGATYYWKVRIWYGGTNYTSYSSTWSFTVNTGSGPLQPIIGGPTNNIAVSTTSPILSWVVPGNNGADVKYQLEVSSSNDMSDPKIFSDIESAQYAVNGLTKGEQYFWRVKAVNGSSSQNIFSNVGTFKIDDNAVTDINNELNEIPNEFKLSQNYPNPFNPTTTIRFGLPKASFVSIKIYNMLGQEVKTLINSEKQPGTFEIKWNGEDNFGIKVASGAYIYRITAGDFVSVKKMVLLK